MTPWQRQKAIEMLLVETEVDEEQIERYADYELEAWLYELDIEWNADRGEWEEQP